MRLLAVVLAVAQEAQDAISHAAARRRSAEHCLTEPRQRAKELYTSAAETTQYTAESRVAPR